MLSGRQQSCYIHLSDNFGTGRERGLIRIFQHPKHTCPLGCMPFLWHLYCFSPGSNMTLLSVICCCCCRDDDSGSKQVNPHCFDWLRHPFIKLYHFCGVLKTLRTKRIQELSLRTQRPETLRSLRSLRPWDLLKNSRPKDFPSLIRIS